MPRLVVARKDQIDAIYRESHAVWGAGLTPDAYRDLWDDVSHTPWAQRWARFYLLVDDEERILSSLKLYLPLIRFRGATERNCVLSAIFTPRRRRQRGYARALVERVLDVARREGCSLALLFSDIGEAYYRSMGFMALRAEEQSAPLRVGGTPPPGSEWSLRPAEDRDLQAVHEAHRAFTATQPFSIVRDQEHWSFLRTRSAQFFTRLGDGAVDQHFRIVTRAGGFAGYLMTSEGRGEWNVREVGAAAGDPALMADVFRTGAHAARRSGLRRFTGWLPSEVVQHLPEWRMNVRPRRMAVPMIRALDPKLRFDGLRAFPAVFIPYQDQF